MKTFETVRDVVDNAVELHRQAAAMYRRLGKQSAHPRARLLLEYMAGHERQMEEQVKKMGQGASKSVLGTYIQYTLEEPPKRFLESLLEGVEAPTDEDVCRIGRAVDNYLVELFEEAVQEMDSNKAAELLTDLMELERLERRKLTMTIDSLQDM